MPAPIEAYAGQQPAVRPPVLEIRGLTKSFGVIQALNDVSIAVQEREIRAICGENGAGKSTFVKILMGLVQPDAGTIRLWGDDVRIRGSRQAQTLGLGLVAQELSLAPHLSILDNIWLGDPHTPFFHRRRRLEAKAREALALLGAADWRLDAPAGELTIGQRQIVEIARLIARDAKILVLDEPTATLSDSDIERMMIALRALRADGRSILYISHRLGEIFELCDSVSVLRNGRHVLTTRTENLTRPVLIDAILGRSLDEMYPPTEAGDKKTSTVEVMNLSVGKFVEDLSFSARRGEITCLSGQIGSGANHVVRALVGLAPGAEGRMTVDGRDAPLRSTSASIAKNIRFISDDRMDEGLFRTMSVLDNIIVSSLERHSIAGVLQWSALRKCAADSAALVALDAARLSSPATSLSGGNQQKVLFARVLGDSRPGVLVLSEPTRGIDVGARAEIYRLMRSLCRQGYALIMYTSDLEEVVGIADAVVTLFRGRFVARYERDAIDIASILTDITHPQASAQ